MPSIDWNKTLWKHEYDWEKHGEEWSQAWGTSKSQWFGSIYPRIYQFLPQKNILEIAPGFGRWSKFLIECCENYVGIDLSDSCIDFCKKTFNKGVFIVNDGYSLDMVPDNSIDFCFSFDSLVHVEIDVIQGYLDQIIQKLTPKGVAFIHHSNFEMYFNKIENKHYRAESVSSWKVREFLLEKGITSIIQESINWGSSPTDLIDTITTFSKDSNNKIVLFDNNTFMQEASVCKNIFSQYTDI